MVEVLVFCGFNSFSPWGSLKTAAMLLIWHSEKTLWATWLYCDKTEVCESTPPAWKKDLEFLHSSASSFSSWTCTICIQSHDLLPFHYHPEHLVINLKDCSRLLGSSTNSVSTSSFSHKHLISEHYILKAIHIFRPLLILSSFLFLCSCLQSVRLRIWY